MTFKFAANDIVALRDGCVHDDLQAGDTGMVWGLYEDIEPLYEVTWYPAGGTAFDDIMREEELMLAVPAPALAAFAG